MGVFELLFLVLILVLGAAFVIWAIGYFATSPVPPMIPKIIWFVVIFVIILIVLKATGIIAHDVRIPTF